MTIREILSNDVLLSSYCIEVNGELYDESKHGDLIHIDTDIEPCQEYSNILKANCYRSVVKFAAIEREKILTLLVCKDKDTDNSLSDFLDKRIKELAKE